MTRIEIDHVSEFAYSQAVFLEPHTIRLCPRHCGRQHPIRFELDVDPKPAGRATNLGFDGNLETLLWFSATTERLRLRTRSLVDLSATDPFAFLLDGNDAFAYPEALAPMLAPFRQRAQTDGGVDEYARRIAASTGGAVDFLRQLTSALWQDLDKGVRREGDPLPPGQTLAAGGGACRDLTELFIDACRAQGLAARFVSGYHGTEAPAEAPADERFLHAWAEVYLSGAGWRGYDPSLGLAVADRHIAVASGPSYAAARPYEGSFRATGATSILAATIRLTEVAREPIEGKVEP